MRGTVFSTRGRAANRTGAHQVQFVVCLLRGKRPEDLEQGNAKEMVSMVILPGLTEVDEDEEAPAWRSADCEGWVTNLPLKSSLFLWRSATSHNPSLPSSDVR